MTTKRCKKCGKFRNNKHESLCLKCDVFIRCSNYGISVKMSDAGRAPGIKVCSCGYKEEFKGGGKHETTA